MSKHMASNTLTTEQIAERIEAAVTSSISARPNGKVGVAVITMDWDGYKMDANDQETTEAMDFQSQADRIAELLGDGGYGYEVHRLVLQSERLNGSLDQEERDMSTSVSLTKAAAKWAEEYSGVDDVFIIYVRSHSHQLGPEDPQSYNTMICSGFYTDPWEVNRDEDEPQRTYTKVALSRAVKKFSGVFKGRLVCLVDTCMSQRALVDNPYHVLAACGTNEEGNYGPTGFGANVERILREALTAEKYLTIGGLYDQLLAAVLTKKIEHVPVFQWPGVHGPTSTEVLLAPKSKNEGTPATAHPMPEAEVRISGLGLMQERTPGTSMVISVHREDDDNRENLTFQAGSSYYILVKLDTRVFYHLEPHSAWRLAFGPCDPLPYGTLQSTFS